MTALTRELERTRNGAKIMERTLEAAKVDIARLRKELEHSRHGHQIIERALTQNEFKLAASQKRAKELEDAALSLIRRFVIDLPDEAQQALDSLISRRAAALLEKK